MRGIRILFLTVCLASASEIAAAQTGAPGSNPTQDWRVTVYPVLVWIPVGLGIDVNVPPIDAGGGGSGEILNSQWDGAFFAGASASNGTWWIEGYGLWAGFSGDRPDRPVLDVDLNLL